MTEALYCIAVFPLLWAAEEDALTRTIPPGPLILIAALGMIRFFVDGLSGFAAGIEGLLCVGLLVLALACLLQKGSAIGGGDVKLCAVLGLFMGTVNALIVIAAALLLLVAFAMAAGKKAMPFAPFILASYIIFFILNLLYGG